jgi:serine phosphatase RsbU (regulator of sigma subunit)
MQDLPAMVTDSLLRLVDTQRFSAYLVVDENEMLVRIGGNLGHYGLAELRTGAPASEQLPFMEGMLPLVETPFLIRSLEMASGRIADVHMFADDDVVWVILLDMTTEHDETQRVQQKAYDMTLLSEREARLIAQLEETNAELARSREELLVTHNRLRKELFEAERYVRSCLPAPITEPFVVDWLFVPTTELGGDSFGYHWLDDEHFAFYLLDVCGHGIGSALLSVAANQTLRSQALPGIDFHDPDTVLTALNQVYQMDRHDDLFFTIWYGVYHRPSGNLRFASAGHPAPIVVSEAPGNRGEVRELKARGPALGMAPKARYIGDSCVIEAPARLYLFSDGVFEIGRPDGTMLEPEVFTEFLARAPVEGESELEALLAFARATHGEETLEDDFSIVKIRF